MNATATPPPSPHRDATIMLIHAQSSLHPGTGSSLGVIDMPVERERHTGWPSIAGSSLKGILRDAMRESLVTSSCTRRQADENAELVAVFGPSTASAAAHAGALSVSDARILAFPVRSMKGVFAYVTCMEVLHRFIRDAALAGVTGLPADAGTPDPDWAWVQDKSPLLLGGGGESLLLEEFEFNRKPMPAQLSALVQGIADHAFKDNDCQSHFGQRLAILHADDFTHFVRHATEVQARIALDYDTKTASDGALFYEEFLPPETLLYSLLFASPSRAATQKTATEVLSAVRTVVGDLPYLQIGAGQTTGKGICTIGFYPNKERS
jgi:CRISPR-associated protein Cmr4